MSKMVALRLHRIETLFTINHWKKEKTVDEVLIEAVPVYQNVFSKRMTNGKWTGSKRMVEEARRVKKSGWKSI